MQWCFSYHYSVRSVAQWQSLRWLISRCGTSRNCAFSLLNKALEEPEKYSTSEFSSAEIDFNSLPALLKHPTAKIWWCGQKRQGKSYFSSDKTCRLHAKATATSGRIAREVWCFLFQRTRQVSGSRTKIPHIRRLCESPAFPGGRSSYVPSGRCRDEVTALHQQAGAAPVDQRACALPVLPARQAAWETGELVTDEYLHLYLHVWAHVHYTPIYIPTYWHTYLHSCIHTHIHTYLHIYLHRCTYMYMYLYICACMHAHMYICAYIYIPTSLHTYLWTSVCTYTYTCIHKAYMHIHIPHRCLCFERYRMCSPKSPQMNGQENKMFRCPSLFKNCTARFLPRAQSWVSPEPQADRADPSAGRRAVRTRCLRLQPSFGLLRGAETQPWGDSPYS